MSVFERCLEKCRARKGAVVYSDGEDRRVIRPLAADRECPTGLAAA